MRHQCVAAVLFVAFIGSPAAGATLTLDRVVDASQVDNPIQVSAPAGDTQRLFILDRQKGEIVIQDRASGDILPAPFFTLPAEVFEPGEPTQNAFSFAFDPDFAATGKVYVSFIDRDDDLRVIEVTVSAANADIADPASVRPVLTVAYDPVGDGTHFGADLDFGPDGYLYISTGDSDAAFADVKSQDLASLQGKVLRVDPSVDAFPGDDVNNFTPAVGNPFSEGAVAVTDAIWALGLRNPFQASFDPLTGAYYIGDVGEDNFEEINIGAVGANFGWPGREGGAAFFPAAVPGSLPLTDPFYAYGHGVDPFEGFSVTGGGVYRGPLAALDGRYFFSDYVTAQIWSFVPDLLSGTISELVLWSLISPDGALTGVLSFGVDGSGNLYIVGEGAGGGVYRIADAALDPVPLPAGAVLLLSALGFLLAGRSFPRLGLGRRRGAAPTVNATAVG